MLSAFWSLQSAQSESFPYFYIDSPVEWEFIKRLRAILALPTGARRKFGLFAFLYSVFIRSGPHECQIGSGEEIRTAVRQTFLSVERPPISSTTPLTAPAERLSVSHGPSGFTRQIATLVARMSRNSPSGTNAIQMVHQPV